MSSENGGEPNHHEETWLDWMPPGMTAPPPEELLTRAELLAEVRDAGLDITPRTFRSWEALGILPRPVRRWHRGAVRATYPRWLLHLVAVAHARRRDHWPAPKIAADVRARTGEAIALGVMGRMEPLPDGLDAVLAQLAARHERFARTRVDAVEVRLLDDRDRPVATFTRTLGRSRRS